MAGLDSSFDAALFIGYHASTTNMRGVRAHTFSSAHLTRVSLNGNDDALRKQIADGSPKMPGFKYHFKPHEIDALVAYLKTVPPPAD